MIKYIMILFMFLGTLQAQEYKAVFDCSSDDARFILGRMNLIEKTILMIEQKGDKTKFSLTLHGGCVPMVSKEYTEVIYDEDQPYIQKAQETITRLSSRKDFEIVVCAMSLENNGLEQKDVLPFVRISPNSFIDTIGYQNDGYALMTFK